MGSLYEYKASGDLKIDTLTDEEHGLRIRVNRHGAELISIARRTPGGRWTGFLHRDGEAAPPTEGWKNHCTVMGLFVHRLKDEHSLYRGKPIRGGTHSFIRHKDFGAPAVDCSHLSLTYTIGPAHFTPEEYPLKVRFNITYALMVALGKPELLVTFHIENLEPKLTAHLSFGLHPGFALRSLARARILMPPGIYTRHFAPGNFLTGETQRIEHPGGPMPFDKAELPGSFLLELAHVPPGFFYVEDPGGHRRTGLEYHEAPYVTLWSDGGHFICVEPCWGLPDHHDQRPFEKKLGIQEIPAGETLTRSFSIWPEFME